MSLLRKTHARNVLHREMEGTMWDIQKNGTIF